MSMTIAAIVLLVLGAALLIASVGVRAATGGKYEIKAVDIVLLLGPILFWLVGTRKIEEFMFAGVRLKMSKAFLDASKAPIESQVVETMSRALSDVMETPERGTKAGVGEIPRLAEMRIEALEFVFGGGGYDGGAIKEYFESLWAYGFLRYAIIQEANGRLLGMYKIEELMRYLGRQGDTGYKLFAGHLNRGDAASVEGLKEFPGFVPAEYAVTSSSTKRSVLAGMESQKVESVPVVDSSGQFIGIVERERLTASLIIEVADKLERPK